MRGYYVIFIIASLSIICVQAFYIIRLHDNYINEKITETKRSVQKAVSEELAVRTYGKIKRKRHVSFSHLSAMTQEERDSIIQLGSTENMLINLSNTNDNPIGITLDDIIEQLEQDEAMDSGLMINPLVLDSIFRSLIPEKHSYQLALYDADKVKIDSVGNLDLTAKKATYASPLYPIGIKSRLYLQINTFIPMSDFIRFQFRVLVMSSFMMLIVISCLLYQSIVIRHKSIQLLKRETSVNGTIHDLKSPLNSIVTMLSWFKMKNNDPKTNEIIETCQISVKHMVHNIEFLLLSAQNSRKRIALNKTKINLFDLTLVIKRELDTVFQGKEHTIEVINKLPKNKIIYADSMYMENVIRNLLENSLKYSDEGVRVIAELFHSGNMLHVEISDNGWGIPYKYRKKIFKQFFQVPRDKDKVQKGEGIGLAHTKNIIKAHGGNIVVKKSDKNGSIFSVRIPLS